MAGKEKEAALSDKIRQLEEEIAKHENWEHTAKDYTLQNVGSDNFAYVYKPIVESNQAKHWACANCFQERNLCILQHERLPAYICPNCGTKIEPYKDGGLVRIDAVYE